MSTTESGARGMAILMVLVFIAISLLAVTSGYERLRQVARSESVLDRVPVGGDGVDEILGVAVARLQTGVPPADDYTCRDRVLSSDGRSAVDYDVTHTKIAADRWAVSAVPSSASYVECPSAFVDECALVLP